MLSVGRGDLRVLAQTHGQPSHELQAGEEDTRRTCDVTFYCQDATSSVHSKYNKLNFTYCSFKRTLPCAVHIGMIKI